MDTGRRVRKKQQTRKAISDVATRLFVERGFDTVTVAEVAAAADVAVQTVFNHFPTKEDLFFDDVAWVEAPARAVRHSDAPAGQVLAAHYRAHLAAMRAAGYLAGVVRFTGTLEASPALRARRARLAEQMEASLAEAIAGGPPDWRARLAAARFSAAGRVLDAELVRRLSAQPDEPERVVEEIAELVDEAYGASSSATTSAIS